MDCDTADTTSTRTCLTRGQSVGLAIAAEAGFISLVAILLLFALIVRNVIRHSRTSSRWGLVEVPADVYMLSLFVSDFLQAIGQVMDVKWVNEGVVKSGGYCTAQGAIQQLGEAGVALATLAIAIHTFVTVWMCRGVHSLRIALFVVFAIWSFVIIFVAAGGALNNKDGYFSPTPYWCWIGSRYKKERIAGEYFWLWLTLLVSILVYVPLFLWNRGNLTVDRTHWWIVKGHWKARAPSFDDEEDVRRRPGISSLAILAYPVAYSVIVLPLSVVRWVGFIQESHGPNHVPSAATFTVIFIYGLSGAVNVLLLLLTRPNLLLFGRRPPHPDSHRDGGRAPSPSSIISHELPGAKDATNVELSTRQRSESVSGDHPSDGPPRIVLNDGRLNASSESGWDVPPS